LAEALAHASHALLGIADVTSSETKSSHDAKLLRFACWWWYNWGKRH